MNTQQACGTTAHILTKNTNGQFQTQGYGTHQTLKTNANRPPRHEQRLPKNAIDQIAPGHKQCKFVKLYQMLQNTPNAQQTLTDSPDTNNRIQKMLLTRLAPSR